MVTKVCFKCNVEKPLDDYYKHKKMGDGHLNKCKDCTKKDSDVREKNLRATSPEWVEKDRKRGRDKYHRLEYKGKYAPTYENKKATIDKYKNKYPEKILAKIKSGNIKPLIKGNNMHHWSYNEEHYKDVIELTILEHNKLHRYMIYDQERMMYRRVDTMELLDTKEKHIAYFELIKNKD